jgi:hypothetical protein
MRGTARFRFVLNRLQHRGGSMNTTKHRKQLDIARRASPARRALAEDAARTARMVLQDEVRARLDQECAMIAFGLAKAELPANAWASTLQSVVQTLREHPVGVSIGVLAAGVAIGRAMQSPA